MPKDLLIVEDALDIQILLKKLFEMEGYKVRCASNGREALERLAESETLPSLILLDLMMPVMDGFEFRDQQRQTVEWSSIPTVVMTADGDTQGTRSKIEATGFLRKPVDIEMLLTTAERYCA